MSKIMLAYLHMRNHDLSLGLGTLQSYLEKNKIHAKQHVIDDINKNMVRFISLTKHQSKNRNNNPGLGKEFYNWKLSLINRLNLYYLKYGFHPLSFIIDREIMKMNFRKHDLVGLSIMSSIDLVPSLVIAKRIKKLHNIPIVLGGEFIIRFHQTINLRKSRFIDYLVTSSGEKPLVEILKLLNNKTSIDKVPSIKYYADGKVIHNQAAPDIEINKIPPPAYPENIMNKIKAAGEDEYNTNFGFPYILIKGCPNNCMFCSLGGQKCEYKDLDIARRELEEIRKTYDFNRFRIIASSINANPQYLEKFCDKINGLGLKWYCSATPSLNYTLLEKMKKSGCFRVQYGIESASTRLFYSMGKQPAYEQMEACLRDTFKAGIGIDPTFIIGYPHETMDDINQTLKFILNNKKTMPKVYLFKFCLRLNTRMYENQERCRIVAGGSVSPLKPEVLKFDEVGGLNWKQKVKHTEKHLEYFTSVLRKNQIDWNLSHDG